MRRLTFSKHFETPAFRFHPISRPCSSYLVSHHSSPHPPPFLPLHLPPNQHPSHFTQPRPRTHTRNMSSDADYASFLDKANQDTGANKPSSTTQTQTQSKSQAAKTKAVNTKAAVPSVLQDVKVDYTSEADEPFEGVSLSYEGKGLPDAGTLPCLLDRVAPDLRYAT